MNIKILMCDDDVDLANLISKKLTKNKYDVEVLTQMVGFMDKVKEIEPDLILMDISMPDINGVQAAKMLYEDDSTSHIPLVFMSADEDIEKYSQQLNKLYIKKPFDINKLQSILNVYAMS